MIIKSKGGVVDFDIDVKKSHNSFFKGIFGDISISDTEKEINENSKNLTPIIPFIFYHGRSKSRFQTNFIDYFNVNDDLEKYILNFKMLLFDTATMKKIQIIDEKIS